jgi:formylmethanofuran dehydrogenase subunit C
VSALTFTLRAPPRQRVDLSALTPQRLQDMGGVGDIGAAKLPTGNGGVAAGELFAIAGDDATEIVIRGATDRMDFIGRDLRQGTITVEGDAGTCLGQGMAGGLIRLSGSAGAWAASAMSGGRIEIGRDAGDFLGGAAPGGMRGMAGGTVIVKGRAGDRVADRMRRGIILVNGAVGAYAGARMIAGTLAVLGDSTGDFPGFAMKRGTLMLRRAPARMLPSFADCGVHDLGFAGLFARALGDASQARVVLELGSRLRRLFGDEAAGGKGEILVWQS